MTMLRHKGKLLLLGLLLLGAGITAADAPQPNSSGKMIVHEWGTFLSVQGSDGKTLGGMVDSEEDLPNFVRERDLYGRNRACWMTKMETPVTYFYVDQPRAVQVKVGMPQGLLTHWYPAVRNFGPPILPKDKPAPKGTAANSSFLDWGKVELIPDYRSLGFSLMHPNFKGVDEKSTWRFARETDSAFVKIGKDNPRINGSANGEWEKFLFYRGLGTFDTTLHVQASGPAEDVHLMLSSPECDGPNGLAIQVENGTIRFGPLPTIGRRGTADMNLASDLSRPVPLKDGVEPAKRAVEAFLVKAGLYAKEARAMVNTWEKSYFRNEGLRLLYVVPRHTTDGIIPIQIQPAPDELVRVMVARIEVLTPATEARIEKAVADLSSKDAAARKAAEAELACLGRLKEPVLHRIEALTQIPQVREVAQKLITPAQKGK
jgi:hypothetical protein